MGRKRKRTPVKTEPPSLDGTLVVIDDTVFSAERILQIAEQLKPRETNGKAAKEPANHLKCPACWQGYGGTAARRKWQRQINGPKVERCYVCGECGHEWRVEVEVHVVDGIEHKTTKMVEVRKPMVGVGK